MKKQLLIGGAALRELGSDRYTEDTDYLVCIEGQPAFIRDAENDIDYINAGGEVEFFAEVWASEANNESEMASPQALLELKAFALAQHCQLGNWAKADACEYDMRFLVRTSNLTSTPIAARHLGAGEMDEINKIIRETRK